MNINEIYHLGYFLFNILEVEIVDLSLSIFTKKQ
jgi:hypothetical protein